MIIRARRRGDEKQREAEGGDLDLRWKCNYSVRLLRVNQIAIKTRLRNMLTAKTKREKEIDWENKSRSEINNETQQNREDILTYPINKML